MKTILLVVTFSLSLAACTAVQLTPEERERAHERQSELHAMRLAVGR